MKENEKKPIFTKSVKAGRRIYYFDVKQNSKGEYYVSITESKRNDDTAHDASKDSSTYERFRVIVFKEDYQKFTSALTETIQIACKKNEERFPGGTFTDIQAKIDPDYDGFGASSTEEFEQDA